MNYGATSIAAIGFLGIAVSLAAAQENKKPITIGVLTDMSGIFSDITGEGSVLAAKMAIESFGGSIDGRPIRLLAGDHLHKPEVGTSIAREWIDKENVDAIVDLPNSSVLLAVQEVARNTGQAILIASGGQTARFNNEACSPYGFQWTTNSYAIANGLATLAQSDDAKKWFFVQSDYAYGDSVTKDLSAAIQAKGGQVLGVVKHPLNNTDFASYILQAEGSKADVITFISSGSDLSNALKQSAEFGVPQKLSTSSLYVTTAKSVGLDLVKGLISSDGYYWNQSPQAAEWSKQFMAKHSKKAAPTAVQIGVYSGVRHYLQAVKDAKSSDRDAVMKVFRSSPVNDAFVKDGQVREDGLMAHDMLIMKAKTPAESKSDWDVFSVIKTVPSKDAYPDLSQSLCPLVKKG